MNFVTCTKPEPTGQLGSDIIIRFGYLTLNYIIVVHLTLLRLFLFLLLFCLQIISFVSMFFIIVSITSFCWKTHPNMRVPVIRNISVNTANQTTSWVLDKTQTSAFPGFFYVECVCNAWFSVEILVSAGRTIGCSSDVGIDCIPTRPCANRCA